MRGMENLKAGEGKESCPCFCLGNEVNTWDVQGQNQLEIFISTGKLMGLLGNSKGEERVDLKGDENEDCNGGG